MYWLIPNKIPIKHELITDKNLQLGESYSEISNRYELFYEYEFDWSDKIINDDLLNKLGIEFDCKITYYRAGLYFFSERMFRYCKALNKFVLNLDVKSDKSNFKQLTNYFLVKAINDNGKNYKTIFETNSSEFIWKFDNYYFIIGIYNKGYAHYDLDKQSIYLTWTKELQE